MDTQGQESWITVQPATESSQRRDDIQSRILTRRRRVGADRWNSKCFTERMFTALSLHVSIFRVYFLNSFLSGTAHVQLNLVSLLYMIYPEQQQTAKEKQPEKLVRIGILCTGNILKLCKHEARRLSLAQSKPSGRTSCNYEERCERDNL